MGNVPLHSADEYISFVAINVHREVIGYWNLLMLATLEIILQCSQFSLVIITRYFQTLIRHGRKYNEMSEEICFNCFFFHQQ